MLIHRYILKELILTFFICLIGLNLILMVEKILKLGKIMSGVGASYADMLRVLILIQPKLLIFTIPMALLLCILITYGKLGHDNELVILQSSGMRFHEIFRPVMYLSAVFVLFTLMVTLYLLPESAKSLREDINRLVRERAPLSIEPGIFFTTYKGIVVLISEKTSPTTFNGVFIYDQRKPESESVIVARSGSLSAEELNLRFSLQDGTLHRVKKESSTEIHFSEYNFLITIKDEVIGRRKNEMTPAELYERAMIDARTRGDYFIEFHRRFSFPALIISIAFLAPSLSLLAGRSGRIGGFIIGMAVFSFYYVILVYFENLVRTEKIHHMASWIPFVMLTVVSLFLYWRRK
jgi:lipopolysaccharide export system permease protein